MANDTDKNPARRFEDRLPDAEIQWDKPGAPAVPKSIDAGGACQGGNTSLEGLTNHLHNAIMNLPAKHADDYYATTNLAYKCGHRDARHDAAELAIAHDATSPIPPLTAPAPQPFSEQDIPADAPRAFAKRYSALLDKNQALEARVAELEAAPAPQESEGLSDERIRGIHREHWTYDEGTHFMSFARAIEREVAKAAPAAPVQTEQAQAEPVAWATYGTKDGKQKLSEPTVASNPRYVETHNGWLWEPLYLSAPAVPAQAEQVAAVRAAALEEAAKTCDWHAEDANYGPAISTAKKCAAAIRALATKEAAAVEAPSQWISVDERLPEDCEDVLVLCPDTGCEPAIWSAKWLAGSKTFESNSNGWADLEDITHWMPRPAAPSQQSAQGDMGGDHA